MPPARKPARRRRKVLIVSRGLDPAQPRNDGRDVDYADLRAQVGDAPVPVVWPESNEPSYLLYTSGTTGKPKGVQRDVGGYAVALALSMRTVFDCAPGQAMFSTSDVGWAVGHSYNVYGPLIAGCTSLLYEGLPVDPDPGVWWALCEKYRVRTMFSSPTAIRVLKKHPLRHIRDHDLRALQYLFLAGEPLDAPTALWIGEALGKPIIDNYWQTETGWPALTLLPGLDMRPIRPGSPGFPNLGYKMKIVDAQGSEVPAGRKGVLVIEPPLPPGCMTTVWHDDARFLRSHFSHFDELLYSSLDWAIRDDDGYTFILGRTDDVINVAGHRLGTREIEEAIAGHADVAEVAVIGMHDELKGQVPVVFATLKQQASPDAVASIAEQLRQCVVERLGAVARPAQVYLVQALPKTRSGKLLRRSLQALAEQRDPGDLSTLDDPGALDEIRRVLGR
ncbi:Propionate-CoA ligase [Xanthomonas translucens pv. phlei]|uniref:Propionate-CoA ligase n=1 Tax=Xanthomonas graminis pv. phlei TaxID=487906 RepID=A0A0K2ZS91_9XANT|nr:Propionate-CoA ligase [Xanthomonas translucens pv. phlei]